MSAESFAVLSLSAVTRASSCAARATRAAFTGACLVGSERFLATVLRLATARSPGLLASTYTVPQGSGNIWQNRRSASQTSAGYRRCLLDEAARMRNTGVQQG